MLRPVAARNGIALTLDAPEGGGVRAGAEQEVVAQALAPLLENALHHARGAVAVTIAREHGEVVFRVRDDGPGLNGADAEQLFEPGWSTVGSAGLGLPLARRVARACGGDVTAEPTPAGASFALRLPALG